MRVITGSAKGIGLVSPKGKEITRPTTDRVKEGIFSAIQFEVYGKEVLDLFAGSGQLGIEALSRGATSCVFVDSNKESLTCIKQNLLATKLNEKAVVFNSDVLSFVKTTKQTFDFIFLDPPYFDPVLLPVLNQLFGLLKPGGKIFCESRKQEKFDLLDKKLEIKKQYKYGSIIVSLIVQREELV